MTVRRALLVCGGLLAVSGPVEAQVTVNPGALDLLPATPTRPAPTPRAARPVRPAARAPSPAPAAAPAAPTAGKPAAPVPAPAAATGKPALPAVPPAIAALPPPAPVPAPRASAPPVVPLAADAPGVATALPHGMRVTFGAERQELNPKTDAALRELARQLRADPAQTVNIYAYATGAVDDPSTARRLALGRALAARAVLVNEGIASTRIYPRSLGSTGGAEGGDRVDVVIGAPSAPAAGAPAAGGAK